MVAVKSRHWRTEGPFRSGWSIVG